MSTSCSYLKKQNKTWCAYKIQLKTAYKRAVSRWGHLSQISNVWIVSRSTREIRFEPLRWFDLNNFLKPREVKKIIQHCTKGKIREMMIKKKKINTILRSKTLIFFVLLSLIISRPPWFICGRERSWAATIVKILFIHRDINITIRCSRQSTFHT